MTLPALPSAGAVARGVVMTAIALFILKQAKPYLPKSVGDLIPL